MGCAFLSAAAIAWWLGAHAVSTALGAVVAALALLAAASGLCVGCELYRASARLRGVSGGHARLLEPADLGWIGDEAGAIVEFGHPLCAECREWEARLAGEREPVLKVDVRERPDLARKYGIAVVPTVVVIDSSGAVQRRLAP
jgi:hypothetical protein